MALKKKKKENNILFNEEEQTIAFPFVALAVHYP